MSCLKCVTGTYVTDTSDMACDLANSLPSLSITSPSNIPHLTDLDADLNMPLDKNFCFYSTHDFHSNYDINECLLSGQSFSLINCNIRSLSANFDKLSNMLSELYFPFLLIGLTEIKQKIDQPPISNTDLCGYQFLSQPSLSNAGGVAFYINNNLNFNIRPKFTTTADDFEALWIEVHNNSHSNLLCGIIYRHPNGDLERFIEYVSSTADRINRENKTCIIMGDFNIDLLKFESHSATDGFLNTLGSNFFQPYILQPTRITDHSATLIDNIFLNSIEHFTISGNIVHDLSDHLPNFLIFNKFSSLPCNVKIFKRDYSKFDQQALTSEIQLVDWETIFVPNDSACNMFKSFYSKISSIINKHIPVKQLSRREIKLKSKPWISKALRKSIQIKNNYYKKYLKTKSTYYHTKFKLYRNKLNHLLKISKKQYYNEYFFSKH